MWSVECCTALRCINIERCTYATNHTYVVARNVQTLDICITTTTAFFFLHCCYWAFTMRPLPHINQIRIVLSYALIKYSTTSDTIYANIVAGDSYWYICSIYANESEINCWMRPMLSIFIIRNVNTVVTFSRLTKIYTHTTWRVCSGIINALTSK